MQIGGALGVHDLGLLSTSSGFTQTWSRSTSRKHSHLLQQEAGEPDDGSTLVKDRLAVVALCNGSCSLQEALALKLPNTGGFYLGQQRRRGVGGCKEVCGLLGLLHVSRFAQGKHTSGIALRLQEPARESLLVLTQQCEGALLIACTQRLLRGLQELRFS